MISLMSLVSSVQAQPAVADYAVTQRKAVQVSALEHAHLMTEMNDFMRAIHGIHTALAAKDLETVAAIAGKLGPKHGSHDAVGKAVHEKLPQEWFALARPTHQNFLAIATEAKKGSSVETILAAVSKTTAQCVSCHSTFRLSVAP
jgi:cytochrome c556